MTETESGCTSVQARAWRLGGRVQGVGFRPFVYRLAQKHALSGWVRNLAGEVEIFAQGSADGLDRFERALHAEAPPLARPVMQDTRRMATEPCQGFTILDSRAGEAPAVHVPPDQFLCADCTAELADPQDRRFRYPFINCTQCGPRYTLIRELPYDRCNTTMAGFDLCPRCAAEYCDPANRRFHAEPVACPDCGPELTFRSATTSATREAALTAAIAALRAGTIIAVKGIGGYHLMCDATNAAAVGGLRSRKRRPTKPLAVMFPLDLALLRSAVELTSTHEELLCDPTRPIVLVPKRQPASLAAGIAPGCGEIGALLPYSPLHHLLIEALGRPLVATSANLSGEPVLTTAVDVETRLGHVADGFLHNDRPIARPADDPVYRIIAGLPRPLRHGRGSAPVEIDLPFQLPRPMLALGGQLKTTIALGWQRRAIVSPHIGDLTAPRSLALLEATAADLQKLYGVEAEVVVCDRHPDYASTRLAACSGLAVEQVLHHAAHASALAAEIGVDEDLLAFTWDGSGLGEDGTLWGGEALLGRPGAWRRVASLRPFRLIGGDRAAREPWRNALSLAWEAGRDWDAGGRDLSLLRQAWERRLNCPLTSSVGRLFDAAAALTGVCMETSFDGEAPMRLEALATQCNSIQPVMPGLVPGIHATVSVPDAWMAGTSPVTTVDWPSIESRCLAATGEGRAISLPLSRRADGLWISDWEPLLAMLSSVRLTQAERAASFHASLAFMLIAQALAVRADHGVARIGLTGGVFQNRVLAEQVIALGTMHGFTVHLPEKLPCNDAGLSFGQIIEAGARR